MNTHLHIKNILTILPKQPGVYQYFDKENTLIYVGKAKNLKNRVRSYFATKKYENTKTKVLVKKITDIKYIVTETEFDALLLENNLIKKYKPKYNIQLKDDKTFPWICITREDFPKIYATRTIKKGKNEYLGPYSSVKAMKTVLDTVKEIYPIRSCNLALTPRNIEAGKFKVCLDYHINKCMGPCENYQSKMEYQESIAQIRKILKGNTREVMNHLKETMNEYADKLQFEKAQETKEKLTLLEKYQTKTAIVNHQIDDVDVFTIQSDINDAYVNFLKITNGSIVQSYTTQIKKKLQEPDAEILQTAIFQLREKFNSSSSQIFTSIPIVPFLEHVNFSVPKIGDKKKLIDFSLYNLKQYKLDTYKKTKITHPEEHANRVLSQIKQDLHLEELPKHIECFDNSNFQGTNAVAACVVFKNAKPSKKDYRHFNIKTVTGPDDFASMQEVVYRRYIRLVNEKKPLPQLIVIDGGKGQLSSAVSALKKLNLYGKIAVIGIAKKLEEIYFPNDSTPLYLNKKSESLKIIQHLRNEAHRFGITHHRNKRSKNAFVSELEAIPGIGEKTIKNLLTQFGTLKIIKKTPYEDLLKVVNTKQAKAITQYFNPQ